MYLIRGSHHSISLVGLSPSKHLPKASWAKLTLPNMTQIRGLGLPIRLRTLVRDHGAVLHCTALHLQIHVPLTSAFPPCPWHLGMYTCHTLLHRDSNSTTSISILMYSKYEYWLWLVLSSVREIINFTLIFPPQPNQGMRGYGSVTVSGFYCLEKSLHTTLTLVPLHLHPVSASAWVCHLLSLVRTGFPITSPT